MSVGRPMSPCLRVLQVVGGGGRRPVCRPMSVGRPMSPCLRVLQVVGGGRRPVCRLRLWVVPCHPVSVSCRLWVVVVVVLCVVSGCGSSHVTLSPCPAGCGWWWSSSCVLSQAVGRPMSPCLSVSCRLWVVVVVVLCVVSGCGSSHVTLSPCPAGCGWWWSSSCVSSQAVGRPMSPCLRVLQVVGGGGRRPVCRLRLWVVPCHPACPCPAGCGWWWSSSCVSSQAVGRPMSPCLSVSCRLWVVVVVVLCVVSGCGSSHVTLSVRVLQVVGGGGRRPVCRLRLWVVPCHPVSVSCRLWVVVVVVLCVVSGCGSSHVTLSVRVLQVVGGGGRRPVRRLRLWVVPCHPVSVSCRLWVVVVVVLCVVSGCGSSHVTLSVRVLQVVGGGGRRPVCRLRLWVVPCHPVSVSCRLWVVVVVVLCVVSGCVSSHVTLSPCPAGCGWWWSSSCVSSQAVGRPMSPCLSVSCRLWVVVVVVLCVVSGCGSSHVTLSPCPAGCGWWWSSSCVSSQAVGRPMSPCLSVSCRLWVVVVVVLCVVSGCGSSHVTLSVRVLQVVGGGGRRPVCRPMSVGRPMSPCLSVSCRLWVVVVVVLCVVSGCGSSHVTLSPCPAGCGWWWSSSCVSSQVVGRPMSPCLSVSCRLWVVVVVVLCVVSGCGSSHVTLSPCPAGCGWWWSSSCVSSQVVGRPMSPCLSVSCRLWVVVVVVLRVVSGCGSSHVTLSPCPAGCGWWSSSCVSSQVVGRPMSPCLSVSCRLWVVVVVVLCVVSGCGSSHVTLSVRVLQVVGGGGRRPVCRLRLWVVPCHPVCPCPAGCGWWWSSSCVSSQVVGRPMSPCLRVLQVVGDGGRRPVCRLRLWVVPCHPACPCPAGCGWWWSSSCVSSQAVGRPMSPCLSVSCRLWVVVVVVLCVVSGCGSSHVTLSVRVLQVVGGGGRRPVCRLRLWVVPCHPVSVSCRLWVVVVVVLFVVSGCGSSHVTLSPCPVGGGGRRPVCRLRLWVVPCHPVSVSCRLWVVVVVVLCVVSGCGSSHVTLSPCPAGCGWWWSSSCVSSQAVGRPMSPCLSVSCRLWVVVVVVLCVVSGCGSSHVTLSVRVLQVVGGGGRRPVCRLRLWVVPCHPACPCPAGCGWWWSSSCVSSQAVGRPMSPCLSVSCRLWVVVVVVLCVVSGCGSSHVTLSVRVLQVVGGGGRRPVCRLRLWVVPCHPVCPCPAGCGWWWSSSCLSSQAVGRPMSPCLSVSCRLWVVVVVVLFVVSGCGSSHVTLSPCPVGGGGRRPVCRLRLWVVPCHPVSVSCRLWVVVVVVLCVVSGCGSSHVTLSPCPAGCGWWWSSSCVSSQAVGRPMSPCLSVSCRLWVVVVVVLCVVSGCGSSHVTLSVRVLQVVGGGGRRPVCRLRLWVVPCHPACPCPAGCGWWWSSSCVSSQAVGRPMSPCLSVSCRLWVVVVVVLCVVSGCGSSHVTLSVRVLQVVGGGGRRPVCRLRLWVVPCHPVCPCPAGCGWWWSSSCLSSQAVGRPMSPCLSVSCRLWVVVVVVLCVVSGCGSSHVTLSPCPAGCGWWWSSSCVLSQAVGRPMSPCLRVLQVVGGGGRRPVCRLRLWVVPCHPVSVSCRLWVVVVVVLCVVSGCGSSHVTLSPCPAGCGWWWSSSCVSSQAVGRPMSPCLRVLQVVGGDGRRPVCRLRLWVVPCHPVSVSCRLWVVVVVVLCVVSGCGSSHVTLSPCPAGCGWWWSSSCVLSQAVGRPMSPCLRVLQVVGGGGRRPVCRLRLWVVPCHPVSVSCRLWVVMVVVLCVVSGCGSSHVTLSPCPAGCGWWWSSSCVSSQAVGRPMSPCLSVSCRLWVVVVVVLCVVSGCGSSHVTLSPCPAGCGWWWSSSCVSSQAVGRPMSPCLRVLQVVGGGGRRPVRRLRRQRHPQHLVAVCAVRLADQSALGSPSLHLCAQFLCHHVRQRTRHIDADAGTEEGCNVAVVIGVSVWQGSAGLQLWCYTHVAVDNNNPVSAFLDGCINRMFF